MPTWAVGVIVGVVISCGGYILRMLVKISGTLGHIEENMESQKGRLDRLERQEDARSSWVERGHL